MENNKAQTFIGFAMRAGKYRIGMGAAETLKKAYLIIVCESTAHNTKEKAEKLAKKFHCPLIVTKGVTLEALTHKENAKVMAVADKSLAQAIIDNSERDFIAVN